MAFSINDLNYEIFPYVLDYLLCIMQLVKLFVL